MGGVLTVLEVVGLRGAREGCKAEALCLLTSIASKGRQYKELLCESYGAWEPAWLSRVSFSFVPLLFLEDRLTAVG